MKILAITKPNLLIYIPFLICTSCDEGDSPVHVNTAKSEQFKNRLDQSLQESVKEVIKYDVSNDELIKKLLLVWGDLKELEVIKSEGAEDFLNKHPDDSKKRDILINNIIAGLKDVSAGINGYVDKIKMDYGDVDLEISHEVEWEMMPVEGDSIIEDELRSMSIVSSNMVVFSSTYKKIHRFAYYLGERREADFEKDYYLIKIGYVLIDTLQQQIRYFERVKIFIKENEKPHNRGAATSIEGRSIE